VTDWQLPHRYAHLRDADRRLFAWEWLRRCPAYRRAWQRYRADPGSRVATRVARRFALIVLEDPARDARSARPVWRSEHDPRVVRADAKGLVGAPADLFDILRLAPVAHVAVSRDGSEHWLFSDGGWLLRLDVVEGTLLGGPTLLRFRVEGLTNLPSQLGALGELVRRLGAPETGLRGCTTRRNQRWITELRTADALQQGASQRQIAQSLFGDIAGKGWRLDSESYRSRTQRLVRAARARLLRPISREWFAT
jgi:hypothetical protein